MYSERGGGDIIWVLREYSFAGGEVQSSTMPDEKDIGALYRCLGEKLQIYFLFIIFKNMLSAQ
jgi:hypothetical protein